MASDASRHRRRESFHRVPVDCMDRGGWLFCSQCSFVFCVCVFFGGGGSVLFSFFFGGGSVLQFFLGRDHIVVSPGWMWGLINIIIVPQRTMGNLSHAGNLIFVQDLLINPPWEDATLPPNTSVDHG